MLGQPRTEQTEISGEDEDVRPRRNTGRGSHVSDTPGLGHVWRQKENNQGEHCHKFDGNARIDSVP